MTELPFELHPIQLGNHAFEGENDAYLLGTEDGATTTLVDTGIATGDTREQLEAGLSEHGVGFADVEQVLLTHWHQDHAGLAGAVQVASGCPVFAHEADAPMIADEPGAREAMDDRLRDRLDDWGVPQAPREELLAFLDSGEGEGDPPTVTTITAGASFDLGPVTLDAVALAGHTRGSTGYAFDGRGRELFSGDALLPYYTPNVGGADTRVDDPLAEYLETLGRIVARGYDRAWPGHRGPIIDPPGRAADIVVHHRQRTERVVKALREHGPADPWTVSAHLFGDLSSIHILHGPGEAYAHLHHLAAADVVRKRGREYELVAPDANLEALFPDVSGVLSPGVEQGPT